VVEKNLYMDNFFSSLDLCVHTDKLTNVQKPPEECNFCDECGRAHKLPLLKTTVSTWAMLTKETEWLIAIHLVREYGNGQINYFFTYWIK
jgi:hypothetical protein